MRLETAVISDGYGPGACPRSGSEGDAPDGLGVIDGGPAARQGGREACEADEELVASFAIEVEELRADDGAASLGVHAAYLGDGVDVGAAAGSAEAEQELLPGHDETITGDQRSPRREIQDAVTNEVETLEAHGLAVGGEGPPQCTAATCADQLEHVGECRTSPVNAEENDG